MTFIFLGAGWKMVKAGAVWKKWRNPAHQISFYEWPSEVGVWRKWRHLAQQIARVLRGASDALMELVVKAGAAWKMWRHPAQQVAFYEVTSGAVMEQMRLWEVSVVLYQPLAVPGALYSSFWL